MLKPYPLSAGRIDDAALAEDRKTCRKIGPCGIGRHALYLNSFFVDRRYYVPLSMVTRVYKRVVMSKGGFSGKGIFATLSYLVVEFDGGQKVCNFKYEQQVDEFLSVIRAEHPSIPCVSAAAEQRIAEEKARREEEERNRPPMSAQAEKTVQALDNAIDYLERRPELTEQLSAAAKRRRNFQCTNGQLPLGRYGDHTAGICGAGLRYRFLRASRLVLDLFYAVRSCRDFHVCRLQRPTDSTQQPYLHHAE